MPENPEALHLFLGTTKDDSAEEPGSISIKGVKHITVHPNSIDSHPFVFNVAVITMKAPVTFSNFISPVCLGSFSGSIGNQVGNIVYGVGFRREVKTETSTPRIKKHVPLTIDSMDRCRSFWDEEIEAGAASEFFCATGQYGNSVFVFEDPLYIKQQDRWYLRGIMSAYSPSTRDPVFYENSGKYFAWIQQQIGK